MSAADLVPRLRAIVPPVRVLTAPEDTRPY